MSNTTVQVIIVSFEALVYGLLILLAIADAMVRSQRNPALNGLIHVTLMTRIVALSALVLGSVLIPSGQVAYGTASVATGLALLIAGALAWRVRQSAGADGPPPGP